MSLGAGVPWIKPVFASICAQGGRLVAVNATGSPSASSQSGWNAYSLPTFARLLASPLMVGARFPVGALTTGGGTGTEGDCATWLSWESPSPQPGHMAKGSRGRNALTKSL